MINDNNHIDGDLSVGRNLDIGGKAGIAGDATIGHNLVVKGWLEAPNIKGINKGIFLSVAELNAAYPNPENGWLAGVGKSSPFAAYVAKGGKWVATGGTIDIGDGGSVQPGQGIYERPSEDPTDGWIDYIGQGDPDESADTKPYYGSDIGGGQIIVRNPPPGGGEHSVTIDTDQTTIGADNGSQVNIGSQVSGDVTVGSGSAVSVSSGGASVTVSASGGVAIVGATTINGANADLRTDGTAASGSIGDVVYGLTQGGGGGSTAVETDDSVVPALNVAGGGFTMNVYDSDNLVPVIKAEYDTDTGGSIVTIGDTTTCSIQLNTGEADGQGGSTNSEIDISADDIQITAGNAVVGITLDQSNGETSISIDADSFTVNGSDLLGLVDEFKASTQYDPTHIYTQTDLQLIAGGGSATISFNSGEDDGQGTIIPSSIYVAAGIAMIQAINATDDGQGNTTPAVVAITADEISIDGEFTTLGPLTNPQKIDMEFVDNNQNIYTVSLLGIITV